MTPKPTNIEELLGDNFHGWSWPPNKLNKLKSDLAAWKNAEVATHTKATLQRLEKQAKTYEGEAYFHYVPLEAIKEELRNYE